MQRGRIGQQPGAAAVNERFLHSRREVVVR